jgi:hypothetical protein
MQELDPQLLQDLTDQSTFFPFPTYKGGVVIVDSIKSCLKEAEEIVKAELPVDWMLELGRILQEIMSQAEALWESKSQITGQACQDTR